MLEITRIDHVSMAVPELRPEVALLESLFGFRRDGEWVDERQAYRGVTLRVPGASSVDWEVLAPLGDASYIQRFLDGPLGPGLHHMAIEVRDLDGAIDELRALGIEPWGVAPPSASERVREAYIHPRRGGNGFLFQLFAADDGVPWHSESAPPPPTEAIEDREDSADIEDVEDDEDAGNALGIIAVNHLSHAHPDAEGLAAWYEKVLGMRVIHRSPEGAPSGFSAVVLERAGDPLRIEILQPSGPDSFVQRFLDARGPAMHHVTFEVGDWERAVAACGYHGVPTFGEREGVTDGAAWREAFIHPRHTGGVLTQFFWQERPGIWI